MVFEYRSDSALDTLVAYAEFTRLPDRLQRFNIEDSEHFVLGPTIRHDAQRQTACSTAFAVVYLMLFEYQTDPALDTFMTHTEFARLSDRL